MTTKPRALAPNQIRKVASEQYLKQIGIQANLAIPPLPDVSRCEMRSVEEIVCRLQSLMLVTAHAEDLPPAVIDSLYLRVGPNQAFTLQEQMLLANKNISDNKRQACLWRYESIKVLLWALGYIKELGEPTQLADIIALSQLIQWQNYEELVAGSQPTTPINILDQADKYVRLAESCLQQPRKIPASINHAIVKERCSCLSWLIGESDWDEACL
ncbi:DUF4272 domain-containing protein [Motilimonas sp. KMU-193]|uniref:DUF4272 domain-containing protein n=1 Tax=Motilimonas sp. KMU-193 TaxID=3388668 RepID=UPI00396AFBDC